MVLIWVANLPKVRFCYRVVVGIPGRTSVPILNQSTPPPGVVVPTDQPIGISLYCASHTHMLTNAKSVVTFEICIASYPGKGIHFSKGHLVRNSNLLLIFF